MYLGAVSIALFEPPLSALSGPDPDKTQWVINDRGSREVRVTVCHMSQSHLLLKGRAVLVNDMPPYCLQMISQVPCQVIGENVFFSALILSNRSSL